MNSLKIAAAVRGIPLDENESGQWRAVKSELKVLAQTGLLSSRATSWQVMPDLLGAAVVSSNKGRIPS